MKIIRTVLTLAVILLGVAVLAPDHALATPATEIQNGVNAVGGSGAPTLGSQIKIVVNILLFILGAIAVVMIVIGGIKYTTSNGDSGNIKTAKDTILYSVIGLVVAMLAYAIVNFVVTSF